YMTAVWAIALAAGLLATWARRHLARPWPWIAVGLAFVMVLPNLLWQWSHGFPFLELAGVAATSKNVAYAPWTFMALQLRDLNPVTLPVWLAGLAAFAFWRRFADLRMFAVGFIVLMTTMIVAHGKPYYPVGAYPVLFAGGAVALETWIASRRLRFALV